MGALLGDGSVRPALAGTASPSQTTNATMRAKNGARMTQRTNKESWLLEIFRCVVAALIVVSIAQAEPAAHAQGTGSAPPTPASLKILVGQTSVAFQIITSTVKSPATVVITACAPSPSPYPCPSVPGPGTLEVQAKLALAANGPSSVSLSPASVNPGDSSMGTVHLKYPAPKDVL